MTFLSKSEAETENIGLNLANSLLNKEQIVLLYGDLGTGKTTLIRGICKGFNCKSTVKSPSFTIVNEYECDTRIVHIDLYRITSIEDFENTGLFDIINDESSLILIEWAENLPIEIRSEKVIKIFLSYKNFDQREIKINENI